MKRKLQITLSPTEVAEAEAKAKELEPDPGWLSLQTAFSIQRAIAHKARDRVPHSSVSVRKPEWQPNGSVIADVVATTRKPIE